MDDDIIRFLGRYGVRFQSSTDSTADVVRSSIPDLTISRQSSRQDSGPSVPMGAIRKALMNRGSPAAPTPSAAPATGTAGAAAAPSLGNAAGIDAMFPAAEAGAGAAGAQAPAGAAGIPGAAIAVPIAASAAAMWKYGLGKDGLIAPKHLWEQTYGRAAKGTESAGKKFADLLSKLGDIF